MTPLEFADRLRELRERATPGPYLADSMDHPDGHALAWIGNWFIDTEARKVNGSRYRDPEADAKMFALLANNAAAIEGMARALNEIVKLNGEHNETYSARIAREALAAFGKGE